MDDRDDLQQDETTEDESYPGTGPSSGRVRIIGAETAGEATGKVPVVRADPIEPGDTVQPGGSVRPARSTPSEVEQPLGLLGSNEPPEPAPWTLPLSPEPAGGVVLPNEPLEHRAPDRPEPIEPVFYPIDPVAEAPSADASSVLPHWTEPPTGQVPPVLARDTGESGNRSAPTWREEHSDWAAHDDHFDPDLYAEETSLGSLDENEAPDPVRRPWEFDLPDDTDRIPAVSADTGAPASGAGAAPEHGDFDYRYDDAGTDRGDHAPVDPGTPYSTIDPVTQAIPVVHHGAGEGPEPEMDPNAGFTDPIDPMTEPPVAVRSGRSRRGGRSSRIRARRPEGALGDPSAEALAAEPPGASVTEVPGVGLRRGGIAGLAAADRSASTTPDRAEELFEREAPERSTDWADDTDAQDPDSSRRHPHRPSWSKRPRRSAERQWPEQDSDSYGADEERSSGLRRRAPQPDGGAARHLDRATGGPDDHIPGGGTNIGVRIATGAAAAVVVLVLFALGTVPAVILCTVAVTFAAGECFAVLRRAGYHPATLLGLVGTVVLMIAAYAKGPSAVPLVLVLIGVFTFLWYLVGIERGAPVAGAAATFLTVGWISLFGCFAALLLAPSTFPNRHGIAFLLGAIIATVANDIGGLVVGKWVGRHPLAPTISPNKTWEGWAGGLVLSVVVSAALVGSIHPWTPGTAAVLGVMVAFVAPIGDLCESLLKRDLHLKDMGTLLPGHGGILDRVDALLFVLPATYYLVRALNIG